MRDFLAEAANVLAIKQIAVPQVLEGTIQSEQAGRVRPTSARSKRVTVYVASAVSMPNAHSEPDR